MTTNDDAVRVGIAGLGRSGWNIHARTLQQLPEQFRIVAVMDIDTDRCKEAEAEFGCRSYGSFDGIVKDRELALLVIATPNRLHTDSIRTSTPRCGGGNRSSSRPRASAGKLR